MSVIANISDPGRFRLSGGVTALAHRGQAPTYIPRDAQFGVIFPRTEWGTADVCSANSEDTGQDRRSQPQGRPADRLATTSGARASADVSAHARECERPHDGPRSRAPLRMEFQCASFVPA